MIEAPQHSTDVFLRRAILDRLTNGPHTAESLAARLNADLCRVRVALAGLTAQGRVVRVGILFGLAR